MGSLVAFSFLGWWFFCKWQRMRTFYTLVTRIRNVIELSGELNNGHILYPVQFKKYFHINDHIWSLQHPYWVGTTSIKVLSLLTKIPQKKGLAQIHKARFSYVSFRVISITRSFIPLHIHLFNKHLLSSRVISE